MAISPSQPPALTPKAKDELPFDLPFMGGKLSPVQAGEIESLQRSTVLFQPDDVYFVSIRYLSSELQGNPARRRVEKEVKAAVVAKSITGAYGRFVAHVSMFPDFVAVISWEQIHFGGFMAVVNVPF
jgi:hypothetical protein